MMKKTGKPRVAVLYGGRSAEHEVSLQSAANVIQQIDRSLFDVIPMGIDKQGNWLPGETVFAKSLEHKSVPLQQETEATWFTPEWIGQSQTREVLAETEAHPLFDVAFPAVHGPLCEDGSLQGLLELANVAYVGCGVLSSAIGMDKDVSKRLAAHAGIPVAPYVVLKCGQWLADQTVSLQWIESQLSYPLFVKPANTGSSIGVTKVKSSDALSAAIEKAFSFDTKIVIEKGLRVRELEVAVLESLHSSVQPIVSVVGEIKPKHEFYSYEAKYVDENGAELIIPAELSGELRTQAHELSKNIFLALECEGMARVDLFLDQETQTICFNEINTIPGFTQISMYPKLMAASGMTYPALLTHLIQLAIKKQQQKNRLVRTYT